MATLYLVCTDPAPDAHGGEWIAFHGDHRVVARSSELAAFAAVKAGRFMEPIDDVRVLTGRDAEDHLVIHGDPRTRNSPLRP